MLTYKDLKHTYNTFNSCLVYKFKKYMVYELEVVRRNMEGPSSGLNILVLFGGSLLKVNNIILWQLCYSAITLEIFCCFSFFFFFFFVMR